MAMLEHFHRGLSFEKRFDCWFEKDPSALLGVEVQAQCVVKKVSARRSAVPRPLVDHAGKPIVDPVTGEQRSGLLPDRESGRKGRIDRLLTVSGGDGEGDGDIKVIIELKSTDWSRLTPTAVRRNAARHAAQLYGYQGHLTNQMWDVDTQTWVAVAGVAQIQMVIVYEFKPADEANRRTDRAAVCPGRNAGDLV